MGGLDETHGGLKKGIFQEIVGKLLLRTWLLDYWWLDSIKVFEVCFV